MRDNSERNRRKRGRAQPAPAVSSFFRHDHDLESSFSSGRHKRVRHKTRQLCRQVFRALSGGLAGEGGDEVLRDLAVHSVVPAPDASRLLVNVYFTTPPPHAPPEHVFDRLGRATGRLRADVAAAIVRKRAPELSFNLVAGDAGEVQSWE